MFRTLIDDQFPDLIDRVGLDGKHIYANRAFLQAVGVTKDQHQDKTSRQISEIPSHITKLFEDARHQVIESGEMMTLDYEYPTPYGKRHFHTHLIPEFDENHDIQSLLSFTRDISDVKQFEEKLKETYEAYRLLARNFPNGLVALYDHDLVYTAVGGKGLSDIGLSPDALIGKRLRDVFPTDVYKRDEPALLDALAGKTTVSEVEYAGRYYRVHTLPIRNEAGEVIKGMVMSQDVTELELAKQRAVELALERQKIDLMRSFVRDASHEFRTPLSSISTALYMIRRLDEDSKFTKYLNRIEQETDQVVALVDDLLVMTRLDSGIELEQDIVDVDVLIRQLVEKYRSEMIDGDERFRFDCIDPPCQMKGDALYLSMAVDEIIDNARRYSKRGGKIAVSVDKIDNTLQIVIKDEGIGIPQEALPRVFDRFFRVDEAHSTAGFGLGLAIARKIIDYHGGQITIESEVDNGTTCIVTLPLYQSADE